jgi:hypothetical protein
MRQLGMLEQAGLQWFCLQLVVVVQQGNQLIASLLHFGQIERPLNNHSECYEE